jgi:hypothetical protein
MTNADRVIAALREHDSLSDSELVRSTGIQPHQQVNQLCHRLEANGVLRRVRNTGGTIINVLVPGVEPLNLAATPPPTRTGDPERPEPPVETSSPTPITVGGAVLVLSCSSDKRRGGSRELKGDTVFDLLPASLADRLTEARQELRKSVVIDDSLLLPAWQRYVGHFYKAAGDSVRQTLADGVTVLIISGGYGIVVGQEPIGHYDHEFSLADWPPGLLEECLLAVMASVDASRLLAFCARTRPYARLVRKVSWGSKGVDARLVAPELFGRGGGQRLVPRALGEAFRAALAGELTSPWWSSDQVPVMVERLR